MTKEQNIMNSPLMALLKTDGQKMAHIQNVLNHAMKFQSLMNEFGGGDENQEFINHLIHAFNELSKTWNYSPSDYDEYLAIVNSTPVADVMALTGFQTKH